MSLRVLDLFIAWFVEIKDSYIHPLKEKKKKKKKGILYEIKIPKWTLSNECLFLAHRQYCFIIQEKIKYELFQYSIKSNQNLRGIHFMTILSLYVLKQIFEQSNWWRVTYKIKKIIIESPLVLEMTEDTPIFKSIKFFKKI